MKALKLAVICSALILAAARAEAYPILQLDIIGGHYDSATQTIVSGGRDFTLVAVLTPKSSRPLSEYLDQTFYISAAVTPQTGPDDVSLGSFSWNGTNFDVTDDMLYGTPPLEAGGFAGADPGDLGSHSIFPTFFQEFSFQFSPDQRTVSYDSAANPSGLTPTGATENVSYYALFNVTTSLVADTEIHFDLYSTLISKCRTDPSACGVIDEDIASFAPFSHDAESSHKVSEPGSMALMSMGLFLAGRVIRRRQARA